MPPRRLTWLDRAACKDADPMLFTPPEDSDDCPDESSPRTRAKIILGIQANIAYAALEALTYCQVCPVIDECLRQVRPETSGFTGIAAGHVWINGRQPGRPALRTQRKQRRESAA